MNMDRIKIVEIDHDKLTLAAATHFSVSRTALLSQHGELVSLNHVNDMYTSIYKSSEHAKRFLTAFNSSKALNDAVPITQTLISNAGAAPVRPLLNLHNIKCTSNTAIEATINKEDLANVITMAFHTGRINKIILTYNIHRRYMAVQIPISSR